MRWAAYDNTTTKPGFTIVELLIVVVVIAILAAIVIVSYNGVTQRAKDSMAQSAVQSAAQKIAAYMVDNAETPPSSLADVGLSSTSSVTLQYSVNASTTPQGYCITAIASGTTAFYIANNYTYMTSSTTTIDKQNPTSGACPGHSTSGAEVITNISYNPSAETNVSGFGAPNSSTMVRDTTQYHTGVASMKTTMPAAAVSMVGLSLYQETDVTNVGGLEPNTAYTVSAWVYVPTGSPTPELTVQGAGKTGLLNPTTDRTTLKNQWVRLQNGFTTTSSGIVTVYVLNYAATTAGQVYYVDDVMITKGTTLYNYADGNAAGWIWSGTKNNSTSTGPVL